ncbi:hypothetical protein OVA24_19285 [Luteolibacter sp. SL250]|uniref:hypothetical protein n=1 Tax=Luteolibacter sp. SL250 TaxID=2995170 RepID=UPI0022703802|nr:hypothetical protein [Luteolibacter sp. SL250]WAC19375.1 hypothetical protein OVA24_19285 [Luteolibacter sp. SL250]
MPDLIQFECPSCACTLRIPIELAGLDGPCPTCQQVIVAPNPYTGIGAYLAVAVLNPVPQGPPEPESDPYAPAFADPQPPQRLQLDPLPQPPSEPSFDPVVRLEPQPEPQFDPLPQSEPPFAPEPQPLPPFEPQFDPAARIEPEPPPRFAETEHLPVPSPENQPFPDRLIVPHREPTQSPSTPRPSHFDDLPPAQAAPTGSRKGLIFGALVILMVAVAGAAFFLKDELFRSAELDAPLAVPPPRVPPPPSIPSINPPASDPNPTPTADPAPPAAPAGKAAAEPPPKESPPSADAPAPKEPTKVITAAETTLRAFLEAPDWASRSTYVLAPESVRPKMEAYAKDNPDGPTPFESFAVKHSQVDEETGSTLFVFQVEAPGTPGGIPVAILETPKGWLVDWESFVEFRDDQFKHFTEGPVDLKGDFHLIVTAPQGPPGTAQENENFAGFTLAPPLPDRQRTAFVRKTSPAYQQLKEATADGRIFTPVLEVAKRNAGDKQSYLEILSIKATDWRPTAK